MSKHITAAISANVAIVTLNRADKRNALDLDMFEGLVLAAATVADNPTVRAVVLTGSGEHFCTGIDVSAFAALAVGDEFATRLQPRSGSAANFFQSAATVWRDLPVPVIAALQGSVFGAGFQIAMGADIRIGAPDVQMSIMEIKWGIIPDMGLTTTAPGVIAPDKVRQLAYTGRIMPADECFASGAVTELAGDPLIAARALATEIAAKSPDAIRGIKALINTSWTDDADSSLRREAELQLAVQSGTNHAEAVRANFEKRQPVFKDPT